jgi:hypothetical protein
VDALVVLEHGKGDAAPTIRGLSLVDARRYGDTMLALYAGAPPEGEAHL